MRDAKKLYFLAISTIMGHGAATAADSIDRLGRLWGFGWSDGYHACAEDCHQVGENLPPLSHTDRKPLKPFSSRAHSARRKPVPTRHGNCASGNCGQNWAPEAWRNNLDLSTTSNMPQSIESEPVPIDLDTPVVLSPSEDASVEKLQTPQPNNKKEDSLIEDADMLLYPTGPSSLPNDSDDELLPAEPEPAPDSDLGNDLNPQSGLTPYRLIAKPLRIKQASSSK